MQVKKVKIDQIKVPRVRVTSQFDEEQLKYLRGSLEKLGYQSPIIVRRINENEYELVDGLHRLETLRERGFKEIEVVLFEGEEREALLLNIMTAVARGRVSVVQVAECIKKLVDSGMEIKEIAKALGHSEGWVRFYLKVHDLPPVYREALDRGKLSLGAIGEAFKLGDEREITYALDYAIAHGWTQKDMRRYVEGRLRELQARKELQEMEGKEENEFEPPSPDLAYKTTCSMCGKEITTGMMVTENMCVFCKKLLLFALKLFPDPEKDFETFKKVLTEYKERLEYERLKKKFEGEKKEE